jgi:hypothetical protein
MDNLEIRRLNMLIRVRGFATTHASDFPAESFGNQLVATVNAAISELESHAIVQTSGTARESTASKALAKAHLIEDLEIINRTAKAIALDIPGLEDKFRLPHRVGEAALLNTARAFLADARPLKADFIKYALPENFLEDLQSDIEALEQAIAHRNSKASTQITTTASIDEALAKGLKAVQQLQAVVKNKYRNAPVTLAEWTSASHVERSSSSGKAKNKTPTQESTPSPKAPTDANP